RIKGKPKLDRPARCLHRCRTTPFHIAANVPSFARWVTESSFLEAFADRTDAAISRRHPMLRIRNMCGLVALGLMILPGATYLRADSQTAVPQSRIAHNLAAATASLQTPDSCETTAAPAPACKTYKPCVTYRGCCDCCGPRVSQVLNVKD